VNATPPERPRGLLINTWIASELVDAVLSRNLAEDGVHSGFYGTLSVLGVWGPLTPSEVADMTGAPLTTVSDRLRRMVADGDVERGVLVCGSGVGVSIVANKVHGVRAVNAHDTEEAEMSRRHNDVNVLTLAGRRLSPEQADAIVETFLATEFEGGRHETRVDLISEVERH